MSHHTGQKDSKEAALQLVLFIEIEFGVHDIACSIQVKHSLPVMRPKGRKGRQSGTEMGAFHPSDQHNVGFTEKQVTTLIIVLSNL